MKNKRIVCLLLSAVMVLSLCMIAPSTSSASAVYGDFECSINGDMTCTIERYVGNSKNVVVPSTINGAKVVEIAAGSFYKGTFDTVVLPNTLKTIEYIAFAECANLKSITIPASVKSIEMESFKNCISLKSLVIENGVKEIGLDAFQGCISLETVKIPNSVESIGGCAFEECTSLKKIELGSGLVKLADTFAKNCYNVESVTIAKGNKMYTVEDGILYNADKTDIVFYPYNKAGDSYTVPYTVTKIQVVDLFDIRNLKTVTIHPNVTTIEKGLWGNGLGYRTHTNGYSYELIPGFTIRGYVGTEAYYYAFDNGIAFEALPSPTSVKLNKTKVTLKGKLSYKLNATVSPSGTLNMVTWTSSNPKVATVSSNGTVTAKETGKTTITVKTFNGKKATCTITVKAPKSVKLNKTNIVLKKKKSITLKATVKGTKDKKPTFTTSNSKVVKIVKVKGTKVKLKALKKGKATIKVRTYNGKTATCKIKVK